MQNLKDWRNKQSDVSTETLADYETKFKNLEDRIAKQECPFSYSNRRVQRTVRGDLTRKSLLN